MPTLRSTRQPDWVATVAPFAAIVWERRWAANIIIGEHGYEKETPMFAVGRTGYDGRS